MASNSLTLRARFPDGRSVTLTALPSNTTYSTLLSELSVRADLPAPPERVLLAGRPPRPLEPPPDTPLSALLQTGDLLIVEPSRSTTPTAPRRRTRKNKSMVERAAATLQKRASTVPSPAASAKRPRVATLSSTRKNPRRTTTTAAASASSAAAAAATEDGDDPRDADWQLDHVAGLLGLADSSDEEEVRQDVKPTKRSRRAPPRNISAGVTDVVDVSRVDPLDVSAMEGAIGAKVVEALTNGEHGGQDDAMGAKFRESLQAALVERQAEADGERRYQAMLAGRVRFAEVARGRAFRVEYRALEERGWTKDMDGKLVMTYARDVLASSLQTVLANEDDHRNLRPLEMAVRSPRVFWNMAKLFPGRIEEGLRELVPDGEWGFLNERRRVVSSKGKRNLENKKENGWTSDC